MMATTGKPEGLRFGAMGPNMVHVCVDMQRMFAEDTPWRTPWMQRVLPSIEQIVSLHAAQTIFTRFVPPFRPNTGEGAWRRYWRRWETMTLGVIGEDMADL